MRSLSFLLLAAAPAYAAITVSGVTDKTKGNAPRSFTVTADPAAATTTATLNGISVAVGSAVSVPAIGFHELRAESRNAQGDIVDTEYIRFITLDSSRGGSEDGIPPHTPLKSVNDAPSAFAGGTLKVIAPAAWPVGYPVPIAAKLLTAGNETLRLNGVVGFGGIPGARIQLRRGWGSVNAPAFASEATVAVNASVNGLQHNPSMAVQNMTFTDVSGAINANTTWPANSRMRVTSRLTVGAGATLTIGPGTIVLMDTGTTVNGSAAEISVIGTLQSDGSEGNPIVFAPATPGRNWGGIELPASTSVVNATYTIFTGAGEDDDWFDNNPTIGGSTHQSEQPTFAIAGSGGGTSIGAQLHLTDCFSFEHAGQQMNSRTNTWIDLKRTLFQKCITSGELNGSKVTIDRSALIEFPDESAAFVNDDNDALYLTSGDLSVTNTILGFCKDDGIDSGADGGNSPFGTVNPLTGNTITRLDSTNNWYEGATHEAHSLSGIRNVYFTGCVFLNSGQGIESGYSAGTGDGPNAYIENCLFVNNMVGIRWGDNYDSMGSYNGGVDANNSIVINSLYHDLFSYNWRAQLANSYIYQTTGTTTHGKQFFNIHDSLVSQHVASRHPANTQWNASNPAHSGRLSAFMPVPDSNVGVAISTYAVPQQSTAAYAGTFTARLSTFSSKTVSVDWSVTGKSDPFADTGTTLASGTLVFPPGQTLQTITAPVASPANYGLIHVALSNPVNAEVTGEKIYITPNVTTNETYVPASASGWRYREARSEPPANWKQLNFDDSSPAATEWLGGSMPAGFGSFAGVTLTTALTSGPNNDRTRAFYFRKKFNVTNLSLVTGLTLRVRRDDGAVVWLNNEATPSAATADGTFNGPYTYGMAGTSGAVPNQTNSSFFTFNLPVSKLVQGENIVAVQVHQSSLTSSDLMIDCELVASFNPPLDLNYSLSNGLPLLWWFGPGDFLERSTDLLNWFPHPASGSPLLIIPNQQKEFFRLRRP